jgi:hypothetical protein
MSTPLQRLEPNPPQKDSPVRKGARVPHSFFYDRLVPVLLAALAVVLVIVVVLVLGALTGVIPIK